MNAQADLILHSLQEVAAERARRQADPGLAARVREVKHYQHQRFQRTYADLLASARYARSAQFFLDDLYGPEDFTQRDEQFARVVPGLVRMFPRELVGTVTALGELHALSEQFDTAMGAVIDSAALGDAEYAAAWRTVGRPADRERQIALMLAVGSALDRYTRNPLLRTSLRIMRGPAAAAGLGALQGFLERGFDTFREMRGASEFLDTVAARERELAARLFSGGTAVPPSNRV
ncbi:MAG: hypothetical protein IH627_15595 [Rubrivivax sp.]|nr:hypothetical protein [Rubrivivax sp.]